LCVPMVHEAPPSRSLLPDQYPPILFGSITFGLGAPLILWGLSLGGSAPEGNRLAKTCPPHSSRPLRLVRYTERAPLSFSGSNPSPPTNDLLCASSQPPAAPRRRQVRRVVARGVERGGGVLPRRQILPVPSSFLRPSRRTVVQAPHTGHRQLVPEALRNPAFVCRSANPFGATSARADFVARAVVTRRQELGSTEDPRGRNPLTFVRAERALSPGGERRTVPRFYIELVP
jgi:hypothetical protein